MGPRWRGSPPTADTIPELRRVPAPLRGGGGGVRPTRAVSNLMRGFAAAMAEAAGLDGGFAGAARCLGVFEVDEATVPEAARALRPKLLLFTNLFRDQLDRYGEVEHVAG